VGRAAASVSRHPHAALLGPQDRELPGRAAQAPARRGQDGDREDLHRRHARRRGRRARAFAERFASHPKATAKITDDLDVLLAFYGFPAEHWTHLRTSNAIESTFATVRLRQRVTKGPGCRQAGVAMAYKLAEECAA